MNQVVRQKRARTDEEKLFRRQTILDAADAYFREVGFEAFSMANLARHAGVAKGTLYLYFETREEVFLALHGERMARWIEVLIDAMNPGITDKNFATLLFDSAHEDATLIPLMTRMDHVIEHNISIDSLVESKRNFRKLLDRVSEHISKTMNLRADQSFDLLTALGSLLMGATRIDQGPALDAEELPDDVRELINAFSSRELFINNACRILHCIRHGI